MDPLSITSGIIAVLSASGKTAQGIEKFWGLRHREKHFRDLTRAIEGLRVQYQSIEPALIYIQSNYGDVQGLRKGLYDIHNLCEETKSTFAALDKMIGDFRPNGAHKPRKILWISRKAELVRLKKQAKYSTTSLTASLNMFSHVQSWMQIGILDTRLELTTKVLTQAIGYVEGTHDAQDDLVAETTSRLSSTESFYTIDCEDESETTNSRSGLDVIPAASIHSDAKKFCRCKCHSIFQVATPFWVKQILGIFTFNRSGSPFPGCKSCNSNGCSTGTAVYMQLSYKAPTWTFLKALILCMQTEIVSGCIRSYNISVPKVIPYTAKVWSLIELGNLSELRELLCSGEFYPHDVALDGTSLLKYAVIHQQHEIYSLLVTMGANPMFCDQSGVIAIQPGVDCALSGMSLSRSHIPETQASLGLYTTAESMAQQDFSELHLAVLGRTSHDLETLLKNDRTKVDSQDVNGRTPLLWAAWRGDTTSVVLLLKYGADINKGDRDSYTPLARASQAAHLSTVQILLTANADLRATTSWGHQPIHLASENRFNGHRVVDELLEWGANPNALSIGSGTPLHNAANFGSIRTMTSLIAHGVNIDELGQNGSTAAMVALYCWNEASFIYLMEAGARLDIVDDSGLNIVQLATWTGSVRIWDLLIERAEGRTLGEIDVNLLHNGHDIVQCYHQCRKLWYIGRRENADSEYAKFLRMIRACGFQGPLSGHVCDVT